MPYSNEIVRKARAELASRKADHEAKTLARLHTAYEKVPRIRQIDTLLRKSMVLAARSAFQQGGDARVTMEEVKHVVRGEIGTEVTLTVLRGEEILSFTLERREIRVEVAKGQMLSGNVGYVKIANFNTNCADETIEAVETLLEQGAQGLIFDVRNNPGGYVDEMLEVLDYLLPKGVLYRDLDYLGNEGEERSDASCLELPMAVLVNEDSYSAAEFFAAAMQEFEWATIVGQHTTGKGHYQNTLRLSDGSAVNLSTGKYFTPSGKNLTETGGIAPDIVEEVDEETASLIYSEALEPEKDPQIQAALSAVMGMVE